MMMTEGSMLDVMTRRLTGALRAGELAALREYIDAVESLVSLPPSGPTPGMRWPVPAHVRKDNAALAARRFETARRVLTGPLPVVRLVQGYRSDGRPITPWGDGNGPVAESGGGANGAA
jgi:hypothetical protein